MLTINKKLVIGILAGIILLSVVFAVLSKPSGMTGAQGSGRIGVIHVEGLITGSSSSGGFMGVSAAAPSLMKQLKEAREDKGIKAVLIRINSPGGSAAASQEIGQEIDKIRKEGKKVVASMGDVAASGGYWIAAKADRIIADPATMTGSIGVIMETENMQELFDKIGISPQTIKSGPFKDMGSPSRPMTDEERNILQSMVDDIYQQFVDVVAEGRKMDRDKVLELADGRIFTGRQAKEKGLVDELGNYYDAVDLTAELAGIKGEPVLIEYGRRTPFEMFFDEVRGLAALGRYLPILPQRGIETSRELLISPPGN